MIIAEFSENTRVKIPALVHTTRLGYEYLSLKDHKDDIDKTKDLKHKVLINELVRLGYLKEDDE